MNGVNTVSPVKTNTDYSAFDKKQLASQPAVEDKPNEGLTKEQSMALRNNALVLFNIKEPESQAKIDKFNTTSGISDYLLNQYGIESEFTSLDVAKYTLSAVEDFVKLNNKDIFKGLKIKAHNDSDNIFDWHTSGDYNDKSFTISYNNSCTKEDIINTTKERYDECYIASDNPKYLFYESLAEFLNFNYNPYAYTANFKTKNTSDLLKAAARKMGSNGLMNIERFNSTYIASKMCKVNIPPVADMLFIESAGAPVKTPKSDEPKEFEGVKLEFETIEEAKNYLKEKYGVEADFANLTAANLMACAIEDYVNLNEDPKMFQGLKIKTEVELDTNVLGGMRSCFDYASDTLKSSEIILNLAYDWERHSETAERNCNRAHYASKSPKYSIYHELAHWLDFKSNPREYATECDKFNKLGYSITDAGKRKFGKVSGYAAEVSTPEFRAEYIAAKMCGLNFPKSVDEAFVTCYQNDELSLKFPKID